MPNPDEVGERLDKVLVAHYPDQSRHYWQQAVKAGYITLNGNPVSVSDKARAAAYSVEIPEFNPDPIALETLHEDDNVVVFNKPSGVLTHAKGNFNPEQTVADIIADQTDEPDSNRAGIVHRLDRLTSGVIIVAKNQHAKLHLQKQFSGRSVNKVYLAVVTGKMPHAEGLIDAPIARNPRKPQTFRADAQGKSAQTAYKTLKSNDKYSLVELTPKTGRTHQLRVHLAHIHHPIVGDVVYGNPKDTQRLMLHALSLTLKLPGDKTARTFRADPPAEWEEGVKSLLP